MANTDLPTVQEIESSPEPRQRSKSCAELFASFIVYLMAGVIVMVITLLIYFFG